MVKQCYRVNRKEQKQLKSIIIYRKKFPSGVHTHEVTDSSSVVSTTDPCQNRLFWQGFFTFTNYFCQFSKKSNGFLTNGGTRLPGQRRLNGIRHILLRGIEKVGVNVRRRGDVAVSQPALNVLDVAAHPMEQGRHAVAKIVEAENEAIPVEAENRT